MTAEDVSLKLVGMAYEAALVPERWTDFLKAIVAAIGGRSAFLRLVDYEAARVGLFNTVGYDPAYSTAYQNHFVRLDPYAEKWNKTPVGTLLVGEAVHAYWSQRSKTEYYNDYEHPQGIQHTAGAVLTRSDRGRLQFAVQRGLRTRSFADDSEAKAILSIVMPHLTRAVSIHQRLSEALLRESAALESLDQLKVGVALADDSGRPFFVNTAARRLISECPALRLSRDGVSLTSPADKEQLRQAVEGAARISRGEHARISSGFRVALPNGNIQVQVVPLIAERTTLTDLFPVGSIAIFLSRPGGYRQPWKVIGDLYGLTRAEARLAAKLAEGASVEAAAEALSVSIQTARTQLKAIFHKTGVSRQVELVTLLLTGVLAYRNVQEGDG